MVLNLDPTLEAALAEQAKKQGVKPEALAVGFLERKFLPLVPRNEWERSILSIGIDCGVSPPDSAFLAENIYE